MINHIYHDFGKLDRITGNDGKRVYVTPQGNSYPSITSVTGQYKKAEIIAWRNRVGEEAANKISTRAATRGTRVHGLCEDFLSNKEVNPDMFDQELWKSIKPELGRINNIHALESPLYSDHLQVAGTVDCIAEYDGRLSVIDFKTASREKDHSEIYDYFMQCSAYAVAFEERTKIPVNRLVIIMAIDNFGVKVFHEKRDKWINKFINLRETYRLNYNK